MSDPSVEYLSELMADRARLETENKALVLRLDSVLKELAEYKEEFDTAALAIRADSAERRLDSAEKRLREACCVDHNWRASTFIEYSTPHWVCNNCGKAEGKWCSQVRTTMASGAASNTAVLSNESAGPHSEAAPVVERHDPK